MNVVGEKCEVAGSSGSVGEIGSFSQAGEQ